MLESVDAFQPQDSSRDQKLSPIQDSRGEVQPFFHTTHYSLAGKSRKVHRNLTNALAPNTVTLFLAGGNWNLQSMLYISFEGPVLTKKLLSTSYSDQFMTLGHSQGSLSVFERDGERKRKKDAM